MHSCTDRAKEQRVGFNVTESFSEPQKTSVSCFTAFHRKQDIFCYSSKLIFSLCMLSMRDWCPGNKQKSFFACLLLPKPRQALATAAIAISCALLLKMRESIKSRKSTKCTFVTVVLKTIRQRHSDLLCGLMQFSTAEWDVLISCDV